MRRANKPVIHESTFSGKHSEAQKCLASAWGNAGLGQTIIT